MEIVVVTLALLLTAAATVGVWLLGGRRRRVWLDGLVRRRLLVHTRDGQTLDGQLARVDADGIILEPATLADGPHQLDGRVWVARERIAWVQEPTADRGE